MNPLRDPDFNPTAETERIQFLMSRQLDGDLTQEEMAELAQAQPTDSDLAFLVTCTHLRQTLQALPVRPVGRSFRAVVRNGIQSETSSVPASSMRHRQRGWLARGIVAVSVASCVAALLLMVRTQDVRPMAHTGERAEAKTMPADTSVADAAGGAEPLALTASADAADLRPFLENDNWRIVVVKVHSKDRTDVLRDIEALVARNGMDMRPVAGNNDHDPRFGILFTSSGGDERSFVQNVLPQTDTQSADWDAQSVAESTRETIIQRIQESLKTPTHSEIHFGQVYVTLVKSANLPAADVVAADQSLADQSVVAKNSARSGKVNPSQSAGKSIEPTPIVEAIASAPKVPVLVVFEFASVEADRI